MTDFNQLQWFEDIENIEFLEEDEMLKNEVQDNEVFLALIGKRLGNYWYGCGRWPAMGTPSRVDFDPELVHQREEKHNDVIGFWHTHPNMSSSPSVIDYGVMGGWTVCFGKPLVCCITGNNGLFAHWFIDDETSHITSSVIKVRNFFIGKIPKEIR